MPNRNDMDVVPRDVFERAEWVEGQLPKMFRMIPLHLGLGGFAELEAKLFPRSQFLPLDPECPECGEQTEDGRVERAGEHWRVVYDCGHVILFTAEDLQARVQAHGRSA